MTIRRGDVFLARLGSEAGQSDAEHAVVVVSRDSLNQNSPVVVVAPIVERASARRRIYPSQTMIRAGEGGIRVDSVVLGEQVRAINVSRLTQQLGHLPPHSVAEISAVLKIVLDL